MGKLLIIAYYFPPLNNIGALRTGKTVKYLAQMGWEPIVITAENTQDKDQSYLSEGVSEANIFRFPSFNLSSAVYNSLGGEESLSKMPSRKANVLMKTGHSFLKLLHPLYTLPIIERIVNDPIGWYFSSKKQALQFIHDNNISVIYSTSNPPTAHFIASWLHKKTGVKWVAEFRDPWVDPYNGRCKFYEFFERKLEKLVIKGADSLVAVSEPNAALLRATHHKKVTVITNGFDEEDYQTNVPLTAKFTVTYTGNIYAGKRDPEMLFMAIAALKKGGFLSSHNFEVRFFGSDVQETFTPLIEKIGIQDMVKVYPKVALADSIKAQKESTILLILEWNNPRAVGVYSGKIFEYLGAGRPILATGYQAGVIGDLLAETGTGILADNIETIKEVLKCWVEEWEKQHRIITHWQPKINIIHKYTRREQARRLAEILENTIELND